MACVIVNHSKMSSLLSWFSYERLWVVTAAEVFVVLSGIVLGMVYGRRLARDGWFVVARALSRRALTLYLAFIAVTISVLALSLAGIDVSSVTPWDDQAAGWFFDPRSMDAAAWRDIALIRHGPWAFEIVGLYVSLVLAAVPCLIALRFAGWRPLLAVSWTVYVWYRLAPIHVTTAEVESVFPILAWQLLFVHGITIGYHREQVDAFLARCPRVVPVGAALASATFMVFALCNPWVNGPSWLHWKVISPEHFEYLYTHYFTLADLGIGRLLNLAIALPLGYVALAWCWTIVRPLQSIFVTLGQRSLGAFVLHVYGILVVAHLPYADDFWTNTLVQLALIVAVAAVLNAIQHVRTVRHIGTAATPQPLAA
jgi:hypothetical protein